MVLCYTTLVPSLGLHIGPACKASLRVGMQKGACATPVKKKRKKALVMLVLSISDSRERQPSFNTYQDLHDELLVPPGNGYSQNFSNT